MGLLDIPWEERILIEYGGGEACTWVHERDGLEVDGLSVRIGPGAIEDFEPGARVDGAGATGTPATGVGQAARWFAGDRTGTLSLTAESSLGQLFVRVSVSRPDLDAAEILSWSEGDAGIYALIGQLQAAHSPAGQEAVLGDHPGMPLRFHEYIQTLTDSSVVDTGGGVIPYVPPADPILLGNRTILFNTPAPFGTTRWHLEVAGGRKACLEATITGDVQLSWRLGGPGASGIRSDWVLGAPSMLEEAAVVVVTTAKQGAGVEIDVKVVDADEDCEPLPTPPRPSCPPIVCDPSAYYRFRDSLPEWFRDLLE